MESKQSRRHFLKNCAQFGGACCALLAWIRSLPALAGPEEKQELKLKPIDFSKLSYCGFPCVQACELYKNRNRTVFSRGTPPTVSPSSTVCQWTKVTTGVVAGVC